MNEAQAQLNEQILMRCEQLDPNLVGRARAEIQNQHLVMRLQELEANSPDSPPDLEVVADGD
jgi:hypothetical protein